jgi:hypothetical protein
MWILFLQIIIKRSETQTKHRNRDFVVELIGIPNNDSKYNQ